MKTHQSYGGWVQRLLPVVAAALAVQTWAATDDAQRIAGLMKAQFDQPDRPLTVAPVSIEGAFAVAGWQQAGGGGRALLQRSAGQWQIVLCAGDALLQQSTLTAAGMTEASARRLLSRVREAEARFDSEARTALSSFRGIARMHGP